MCGRIVGVELQGPAKLRLGRGQLHVEQEGVRQRGVRLGQAIIEFRGFASGGQGGRNILVRRSRRVNRQDRMGVSQSRISQRISRVLLDRLLKIVDRFPDVFRSALVPEEAPFQIELVRLRIFCRP